MTQIADPEILRFLSLSLSPVNYTEIEVSNDQNAYEKYQEISGMRTVPQIFNGEASKENLIGWYDDMMTKFKAGELFKK